MRNYLKKISLLKYLVLFYRISISKPNLLIKIKLFINFILDFTKYKKIKSNYNFITNSENLFPRIFDRTLETKLDPVYFIQGCWCARKIFENRPTHHYDVGSQAQMVGIISQFTPTTMIDIRPLSVEIKELSFIKGDITKLPFADNTIMSISSICVIEHIGLGRYGDKLNPFGTENASDELSRVLAKNGNLYVSVPIDKENVVYFNAHRSMTRNYVLKLFGSLKLVEEKYIYGNELYDSYDSNKGFGTGLFYFTK